MTTPRGDELAKLSLANAIAEWLYFSELTGTIERESYEEWKLWLAGVPVLPAAVVARVQQLTG